MPIANKPKRRKERSWGTCLQVRACAVETCLAVAIVTLDRKKRQIICCVSVFSCVVELYSPQTTVTEMANRNLKHVNIQNSSPSPKPQNRSTDSPSMERVQKMEGATPSPQVTSPQPEAESSSEAREVTLDLKSFRKPGEKTFTQRCRLFVGNLPTDIMEEDFRKLFSKYGEANEVFINRDRGFGFIRLVRTKTWFY